MPSAYQAIGEGLSYDAAGRGVERLRVSSADRSSSRSAIATTTPATARTATPPAIDVRADGHAGARGRRDHLRRSVAGRPGAARGPACRSATRRRVRRRTSAPVTSTDLVRAQPADLVQHQGRRSATSIRSSSVSSAGHPASASSSTSSSARHRLGPTTRPGAGPSGSKRSRTTWTSMSAHSSRSSQSSWHPGERVGGAVVRQPGGAPSAIRRAHQRRPARGDVRREVQVVRHRRPRPEV